MNGWRGGRLFLCILHCLYLSGWENKRCQWLEKVQKRLEKAAALSWRKCKNMWRAILKWIHPCRVAGPIVEGEGGDAGTAAALRALNHMPPIHMAMWSEAFQGSSSLEKSREVFRWRFYGSFLWHFIWRKAGERQPSSDPAAWLLLLSWAKEALQSEECIPLQIIGKLCFNDSRTDSAWRNISCKNYPLGKEAWKSVFLSKLGSPVDTSPNLPEDGRVQVLEVLPSLEAPPLGWGGVS